MSGFGRLAGVGAGGGGGFDFSSLFGGGGGAMLGGSILSTLGGVLGAQSANRNARLQQDENARETSIQRNRAGGAFFGSDPYQSLMTAGVEDFNNPGGSAKGTAAWDKFNGSIGGNVLSQLRGLEDYGIAGSGQIRNGYADATRQLHGQGQADIGNLQRTYAGNTRSILNDYDQQQGGLMDLVGQWGKGREDIIRQDAGQSLKNTNQQTLARLAASGFGNSTVGAQALVGNADQSQQTMQRALQDLSEGQIDRQSSAMMAGNAGRSQLQAGRAGAWEGALERGQNRNFASDSERATGQAQIDAAGLDRNLALKQNTLSTLMGQIGSLTQPNTQQYIPSYSAVGTGLTNGGNALAQYGQMQAILSMMG